MNTIVAEMLMKKDLTAVMETDTVEDAIHVLHSHGLSGVPVVDEAWHLMGFFAESDVLRSSLPTYLEVLAQDAFLFQEKDLLFHKFADIREKPVSDYMQRDCFFVSRRVSIMNVADLMLRRKIKRLPVVDGRLLIGVIDRGDFCEYLMRSGKNNGEL